jgi:proteic killer suppression protein
MTWTTDKNCEPRLPGDRNGTWSLSATRNRRLTFCIDSAECEICDLNLEDYH